MVRPQRMRFAFLLTSTAIAIAAAHADPVPRTPTITGQVVQTRAGEAIDLIDAASPPFVEVRQDVKAGDVIRTNASGQIALLFSDRTQIRVARNSVLVVREVRTDGGASLDLQEGQVYARAAAGGSGVTVATPAATAAIRGTDWTMTVQGDRTTLSVIDGLVELSNPQGTLNVGAGESAAATLGSAPSRIVIAGGTIREQMLFNLSLRDAFTTFSIDPTEEQMREGSHIAAVPLASRDAEQRVSLAEVAQGQGGIEAARRAAAEARALRLTRGQEARLAFVEAGVAGAEARYDEAARLYDRAAASASGERRTQARYLAYFARSLADPASAAARPRADASSVASISGEAQVAALLESPRRALEIVQAGEPRFGKDVRYQAQIARYAILASDFDAAAAAIAKGEAIEPTDAALLDVRATYRSNVKGDIRGALADAREAARQEPGNADYWNSIGILELARGAKREAGAAYERSIALNPYDPAPLSNYAGLLLLEGRNAEAGALIDRALALDPAFSVAFLERGRKKLQAGDEEGALEDMLRATTANPTYGDALLALGATYAARREIEPARQSFALAGQLDPLSPDPAQFQALLSVFNYEADDAVRFARESLERTRARGGDYASVKSSGDFGSVLGGVYRFVSLDAWGRYYGDRTFDPFQGASYFDQALTGTLSRFYTAPGGMPTGEPNTGDDAAFSLYTQGLLLDPLAGATPRRRPSFYRTPFQEVEVGAGVSSTNGEIGGAGTASYQRLGYTPLPYSLAISSTYTGANPSYATQDVKNLNSTFQFGAQTSPNDTVTAYFNGIHAEGGNSLDGVELGGFDLTRDDTIDASGLNGFVGWSHSFGYHNLLSLAISGFVIDSDQTDAFAGFPDVGFGVDTSSEGTQHTLKGGASYLLGVTDDLTLRLGAETGDADLVYASGDRLFLLDRPDIFRNFPGLRVDAEDETSRFWVGAFWDALPGLTLEGTLFGEHVDSTQTATPSEVFEFLFGIPALPVQTDTETDQLSPRAGVAWAPLEGQYLRAAFLRETPLSELNTLAPVGVVGLRSDLVPEGSGNRDTTILHWDSEWTDRFFTATEYQHQEIENLLTAIPLQGGIVVPNAEIDRLSLTGNLWLGGGVSAFGSYTRLWSRGDFPGTEETLPFVPEYLARVGLSYISPARFRVAVAETYVGKRSTFSDPNLGPVTFIDGDSAFVTDISAGWESEDRHLALQVSASNLFGAESEVAPFLPALARSYSATIQVRF